MNETYFGKGAHLSPPDERDFTWENLGASAIPFNWELGYDIKVSSLKDQNGSFSCGGQALSYYGEILESMATGSAEPDCRTRRGVVP
jgi:hypothetical protein